MGWENEIDRQHSFHPNLNVRHWGNVRYFGEDQMLKFMLKSKLHRATVTEADINYEGSITIDQGLMESADMLPYERVDIYNISNGERFSTYLIAGKRDSGTFCLNGAAARKASPGDLIIVASYAMVDESEAANWRPKKVLLDKDNHIKSILS